MSYNRLLCLCSALLAFFASTLAAADNSTVLKKGLLRIDGGLSLDNYNYASGIDRRGHDLQASLGYFAQDNLSLDFELLRGVEHSEFEDAEVDQTSNGLAFGLTAYRPFESLTGYLGGGVALVTYREKWTSGSYSDSGKLTSRALRLHGGLLHKLSDFVFVDGGLYYIKANGDQKHDNLGFMIGLAVFFDPS